MLFFIYNILFLFYSYNFLCGKEASKFNTKKRLITGVIILFPNIYRLEESSMQKPHRHLLPRTNVESRPSSILLCLCFLRSSKVRLFQSRKCLAGSKSISQVSLVITVRFMYKKTTFFFSQVENINCD